MLYEDEGNNYNFENGAYATTRFQWKDAAGQLVNGRREGSFPGMREAVYETVIISRILRCGKRKWREGKIYGCREK